MNFSLLALLAAAGGGFFAAAIGALNAFIFTGFAVGAGVGIAILGGGSGFLSFVAFGPVFGPHIAFAGGVAAAAYAARVSKDVGGKDIGVPLIQLERPDVLLVGAGFGVFGYVVQLGIAAIPGFGTLTDSVALTVVISALVVRLLIGRTGLVGTLPEGSGWGRFAPNDEAAWVRWHERFVPNTVLGLGAGLLAAGLTLTIARLYPDAADVAPTLMFGFSAMSLFFLSLGQSFPVTHHITLIAGVAAATFLPVFGGNEVAALIVGAIGGMLSAWAAEFFARLLHNRGNTHIDPPAAAIWPMTTLFLGLGALLGAAA
jgi:hypothetical protein